MASDADALMVIVAGAMNVALLAGDVIDAVGGVLLLTVMFTAEEVVTAPWLSVARAVSV